MKIKHISFLLLIFLTLGGFAYAEGHHGYLTALDIQRVKDFKALLSDVDTQPLQASIHDIERARHPHLELAMKEAMARAYTDIVREINVEGQKKRQWLYSLVCLNMAYLQFGGDLGPRGSTTELNRLILKKLKEYLPPNVLKQPGFVYSLD